MSSIMIFVVSARISGNTKTTKIRQESSSNDSLIVLHQPDETISLEVKLEQETVWLTQAQMVELFSSSKSNLSEHIPQFFQQGELLQEVTVRKFRIVRKDGNRMVSSNVIVYI